MNNTAQPRAIALKHERKSPFGATLQLLAAAGSLFVFSAAQAFDRVDLYGDPCPTPVGCVKGKAKFGDQDNGYHNKLQGMHGVTDSPINTYMHTPENFSTTPPTPAVFNAIRTPDYTGGTDTNAYKYKGEGAPYTKGDPKAGPPPTLAVNPQLDPGIQGAMPRYKADATTHKFMPPKNTPAISLVERFPWLFMNVDTDAQYFLYRGTGNNTYGNTNSLIPSTEVDAEGYEGVMLAPTDNSSISSADNPAIVDTSSLDKAKCQRILFDSGACMGIDPLSIIDSTMSSSPTLLNRLQYDSCTNQYLLPMGLNPNYVMNDKLRHHDVHYNESWCQPFKMKPVDCYRNKLIPITRCLPDPGNNDGWMYDYRAWGYLELAWKSVMNDEYTPSGGAGVYYGEELGIGNPPYLTTTTLLMSVGIPTLTGLNMPSVLKLKKKIPGEEKYGRPFIPLFPGGAVGPIGSIASVGVGVLGYSGARTKLNDLAARPYERIWDPTHPYSPRWDFKGTDRLFSELARVTGVPFMGYDTGDKACIVRCAAVPVDVMSFRLLAFAACIGCRIAVNTECFWRQVTEMMRTYKTRFLFITIIWCRGLSMDRAITKTARNHIGDFIPSLNPPGLAGHAGDGWDAGAVFPDGCHYGFNAAAFCKYNSDNTPNLGVPGAPQPKKTSFSWPKCSTKYDYQDPLVTVAAECYVCTLISGDPNPLNGVQQCCNDLAHALAPLNTLKIRNTIFNPGLAPVPEGYRFGDYFSTKQDYFADSSGDIAGHMPYMRWWDTGQAAGGRGGVGTDYDPDSDCGTFDAIVGVGTEDWWGNTRTRETTDGENKSKICRYGGNGFAVDPESGVPLGIEAVSAFATSMGIGGLISSLGLDLTGLGVPPYYKCIRLRTFDLANMRLGPDAMTSWLELKQYQTNALRNFGLNCLPQYEKLYKPFGNEDGVLQAAGGYFIKPTLLSRTGDDNRDVYDSSKGPEKSYFPVQFWGTFPENPPSPIGDASGGGTITSSSKPGERFETHTASWPLSWRGYASDPQCDDAFPNFSGDGSTLGIGLTAVIPCVNSYISSGTSSSGFGIPGMGAPLGNVPPIVNPSIGMPEFWPFLPPGLDKAEVGDVIFLTHEDMDYQLGIAYLNVFGGTGYYAAPLPGVSIVTSVQKQWLGTDGNYHDPVDNFASCPASEPTCFTKCQRSITISDVNTGKFPDACGNTDYVGMGQSRTIYKEWIPDNVADITFEDGTVLINNCGNTHTTSNSGAPAAGFSGRGGWGLWNNNYGNCADPKMSICTHADFGFGVVNNDSVNLWNHYRIYRPLWDIRQ